MVGTSPPPGLCSFSTQRRCSVDVKTITELRISAIKQDQRGWMSENYPFLQRREKCFLLTSPFIEPALRTEASPTKVLANLYSPLHLRPGTVVVSEDVVCITGIRGQIQAQTGVAGYHVVLYEASGRGVTGISFDDSFSSIDGHHVADKDAGISNVNPVASVVKNVILEKDVPIANVNAFSSVHKRLHAFNAVVGVELDAVRAKVRHLSVANYSVGCARIAADRRSVYADSSPGPWPSDRKSVQVQGHSIDCDQDGIYSRIADHKITR